MAFSYSFHISAKSHAVTNKGKIEQVGKHNLRVYESKNYDKNLIETRIGSDNLLTDVEQMYHKQFDDVLEKYNEGKRADRKIDNYFDHVSNSRSDVGVEIIIQVGDEEFWKDKSLVERKQMTKVFDDQILALERYCPEFKIVNATIHYDEKSPHIHVVGVPVADGYKKGMERQCAKTKVFTAEKLSFLQDVMRADAEQSMKEIPSLFADMELKAKEKGRNKDIPKESLTEFYSLEAENKKLQKQSKRINQEIAENQNKANEILNEAAAESERITAAASKNFDEMLDRVIAYEAEQKEKINQEVSTYRQEVLKPVEAEISFLEAQRDTVKADTDKALKKLDSVQAISKYMADETRPGIKVKDIEVKDGLFASHSAVIVEGLEVEQVKSIFRASAMRNGAVSEAQSIVQQGKDEADQMREQAQREIQQAQNIINQQNQILQQAQREAVQIKEKAERERKGILQQAKEQASQLEAKAEQILNSLKEQISSLKDEIRGLFSKRDNLQAEQDKILEQAKIQADEIILKAHEEAGTDRLYQAINERLGIVPLKDVADARNKLNDTIGESEELLGDKEYDLINKGDYDGIYSALREKVKSISDDRPFKMCRALEDYVKAEQAPHSKEDVLKEIQYSMNRSHNRGHSR